MQSESGEEFVGNRLLEFIEMKKNSILFLVLFTSYCFANMAQPYDGNSSRHSILFSSKELDVVREFIKIKIFNSYVDIYTAHYFITYEINSPRDFSLPLLFVGDGLANSPITYVNGKLVKNTTFKNKIDPNLMAQYPFLETSESEFVTIKYDKDSPYSVAKEGLVYFESPIKKGKNTITIEYDGNMESNNYGFIRKHDLEYALFPSRFWKSFGPIQIDMELPKEFEIDESSIGEPISEIENNKRFILKSIPAEDLKIKISPRISFLSRALITVSPLGIAIISTLLLMYFHFVLLKRKTKKPKTRFNWVLILGIFTIPILFYTIFLSSYGLIDLTLGENSLNRHGYIFLIVVTLPLFWLIYGFIIWVINLCLKK
jgi:hypothetical protein